MRFNVRLNEYTAALAVWIFATAHFFKYKLSSPYRSSRKRRPHSNRASCS